MLRSILYATTVLTVGLSTAVMAIPIESFEADPFVPRFNSVSQSNQSPNSTNLSPSLEQSNLYFTDGNKSGLFKTTWKLAGPDSDNPFGAGTAPVWGHRFNVPSPGALTGNSLPISSAVLQMDVFNPNTYPINVTLAVSAASGMNGLRRGPYLEVPPGESGQYVWNLASDPIVAIYAGSHGTWESAVNVRIASLVVWADDIPEDASPDFELYVDNIRNEAAQADVTAPAKVKILSATQGSAPGKLLIKWEAVGDADLDGYNVYVKDSSAIPSATPSNKLDFGTEPSYIVPKTQTSIEVDIATEQTMYIAVTSFDNATPNKNESDRLGAFAVRLKSDGTPVENHIILDHDRYTGGLEFTTTQGYAHGVLYNALALEQNNKYFDSASAKAVDTNQFALVPNPNGIVIWSNLLDGVGGSSVALTDESVTKLSDFYYSFGNLMISGPGLAEDLSTRGPLQQAFLNEVLKAELVSGNVNTGTIVGDGSALLPNLVGNFSTIESVYTNHVSGSVLSNDQLAPVDSAVGDSKYTGDLSYAVILNTNRVVAMGFAFETLGIASDTGDASRNVRGAILNDVINYLLSGSDVSDWNLY